MTACPDQTLLIHGLIDGELDAANALACEAHVKTCEACHAEFLRLQGLREAVAASGVAYRAPQGLRARIEASLAQEAASPARRRAPPRVTTWAASGGLGAVAASLAILFLAPNLGDSGVENQLIASHVRSLLANHLTDVVTSDKHVVKPWFNGKIDFSPPVPELADLGFPLAGGRLDYVEGRVVPAIVYHRRLHTINVFAWPHRVAGVLPVRTRRRDGYSLIEWNHGDLEFWAVSDIDPTELRQFQQAYAARS
jgi:anti-sigma factor RsiW